MEKLIVSEQTNTTVADTICSIDSDRESTKSDSECEPSPTVKKQEMFIWNEDFEKWHECSVEFSSPSLQITEYEDQKLEVDENQLQHLNQSWFYGNITRREARVILQDFNGGTGSFLVRTSESYHGKFAISFVHQSSVKHVVIESRRDPVAGILYHITPNGPVFNSLYELIETGKTTPLIQNHVFNIQLTCSPPKPDMTWLHTGVKSLSQAEQILRKEHKDGAFFVYRTQSQYAPYIVAYRTEGTIMHNLIVYTNRSNNGGYTLNNVTSQVLYKVIHYFMENPISEKTVLKYPVPDRSSAVTNCGIALKDWLGDREMNELRFTYGALVTNIKDKTPEWSMGDHRGDKQKYFKRSHVRLLTKDELAFVEELREMPHHYDSSADSDISTEQSSHTVDLCLRDNYRVELTDCELNGSAVVSIRPSNNLPSSRSYQLSCSSTEDLESWYKYLQTAIASSKLKTGSKHSLSPRSLRPRTKTERCTIS